MEIKPEWVSALSSFVGALAIVFVAIQSYLAKKQLDVATKQMEISAQHQKVAAEQLAISARQNEISTDHLKADHERSRRERAIDVLARWATTLDKAHPSARKLVESFDHSQCEKLRSKKGFRVPIEKTDLVNNVLHGYLEEDPPQKDGDFIILDDNHASHIYFLCISHLNSLEIALQPWLVRIADEKILESELQYLVKPEKGHYVLETFRNVMGGKDSYPAIHEFVIHIKDKKNGGSGRRALIA